MKISEAFPIAYAHFQIRCCSNRACFNDGVSQRAAQRAAKLKGELAAQKVKPKAVIATQDVVDNIIKDDKQKTFDAAELEAKIAKPINRIPINPKRP